MSLDRGEDQDLAGEGQDLACEDQDLADEGQDLIGDGRSSRVELVSSDLKREWSERFCIEELFSSSKYLRSSVYYR